MLNKLNLILKFFQKTKQPKSFKDFKAPNRVSKKEEPYEKIKIIPELEQEVNNIFNELGKIL